MPEDLHLTIPAMCEAKVVSAASDYNYYHCSWRDNGGNAFGHIWDDFESNMRSYRPLMEYLTSHFTPRQRQIVIMRRLLSQDVLFMAQMAAAQPEEERSRRNVELRKLFGNEYSPLVRPYLEEETREVLDIVLLKRYSDLAFWFMSFLNNRKQERAAVRFILHDSLVCGIIDAL